MTRRPPLLTLLASLTIHSAALAVLLFFASGEPVSSALVVDLSERENVTDEGGPKKERAGSARSVKRRAAVPSAPSARSVSPPSPPAPVEAAPSAVAPPAPSRPEPAPPPEREIALSKPPELRQPESAPAAVSAFEEAPDGVARRSANASAVEVRVNPGDAGPHRTGSASDESVDRRGTHGSLTAPGESSGTAGTGVALAPAGPPGGEPGSDYDPYYERIRQRIQESLKYPPVAFRRGIEGTVHLEILIKPDGAIGNVSVMRSSTHRLLDEAALELVRSLAPQPFPAGLAPRLLTVRLPVVYELK